MPAQSVRPPTPQAGVALRDLASAPAIAEVLRRTSSLAPLPAMAVSPLRHLPSTGSSPVKDRMDVHLHRHS